MVDLENEINDAADRLLLVAIFHLAESRENVDVGASQLLSFLIGTLAASLARLDAAGKISRR